MTVRKEVFSEKVAAGPRTYFFDVKEGAGGALYLCISETQSRGKARTTHDRVMVFPEHLPVFLQCLKNAARFMQKTEKDPKPARPVKSRTQ